MLYQFISDLNTQGKLSSLVEKGLIAPKVKEYFEIYSSYKNRIDKKSRFKTVGMIILEVQMQYNVPRRKVYRAISSFED